MSKKLFRFALAGFAWLVVVEARAADPVPYQSTASTIDITNNIQEKMRGKESAQSITTVTEYFKNLPLNSEIGKNVQNLVISLAPEGNIFKCDQYVIAYNKNYQKDNRYGDRSTKAAVCSMYFNKQKKTALICYNFYNNARSVRIYSNDGSNQAISLPTETIASFLGSNCPPAP
jgi:hypothetical protein